LRSPWRLATLCASRSPTKRREPAARSVGPNEVNLTPFSCRQSESACTRAVSGRDPGPIARWWPASTRAQAVTACAQAQCACARGRGACPRPVPAGVRPDPGCDSHAGCPITMRHRVARRPELLAPRRNPVTHEPGCSGNGGLTLADGREGDRASCEQPAIRSLPVIRWFAGRPKQCVALLPWQGKPHGALPCKTSASR